MTRVAGSDRAASQAAVQRLHARVQRASRALLRNESDAKDASQLSLVEIPRSAHAFRDESSLERWADRSATRTAVERARRSRSKQTLVRCGGGRALAMKSANEASSRPRRAGSSGEVAPLPFMTEDVALLVAGLRAGDADAKAAFYRRYAADVERMVTHLIGADRDLADILQEVFVQALSSVGSLRDPAALKSWLLRIAMHCAWRTLRTRTSRAWLRIFVDAKEEARFEPVTAGFDAEGRETVRAVYATLGRLPAEERIAFALRYVDGMNLVEVAQACAVSLATAKRRIRRAEQRFVTVGSHHPALARWLRPCVR
jgi:RNA polymerase sigma-70 factor (ECF subfamily)